jgi:hypothetical protein
MRLWQHSSSFFGSTSWRFSSCNLSFVLSTVPAPTWNARIFMEQQKPHPAWYIFCIKVMFCKHTVYWGMRKIFKLIATLWNCTASAEEAIGDKEPLGTGLFPVAIWAYYCCSAWYIILDLVKSFNWTAIWTSIAHWNGINETCFFQQASLGGLHPWIARSTPDHVLTWRYMSLTLFANGSPSWSPWNLTIYCGRYRF